jgi:hypothetical protein
VHIDQLIQTLQAHRDDGVTLVDIQLHDPWSGHVRSYPLEETQLATSTGALRDPARLTIDATP